MNGKLYLLITLFVATAITVGSFSSAGAIPADSQAFVGKSASVEINGVSTPCSTFSQCENMLVAGAIMRVSGEWSESLDLDTSGTAAKPIKVIGSSAVIDTSEHTGITVTGNYVSVSGFEVTGTDGHGVFVSSKNVTIENTLIHHSVTGNGTIGNCGGGSWDSALKLAVGAENVILRGNTIYENCGEGIAASRAVNVLIENNTVRDNHSVNIYADNSPFVVIRNNTSTCTGLSTLNGNRPIGISLGEESYSGWGAQRHDITVENNIVTGCGVGIGAMASNVDGTLANVTISTNLVTNGTTRSISILSKKNSNVLVKDNQVYNEIYVRYPAGVTLTNNTIVSSASTFLDVPISHPLHDYIEALYDAGYTAGCSTSPLMYCPDTILDRAQSAVFMLRGQLGIAYTPPPAPWDTFADDWTGFTWAEPWAEGMYQEGLTAGCHMSPLMYCPAAQLPRVEASVFGLRLKYGVNYSPPAASGVLFADFPSTDPSYWAIDWAEQAYLDGLLPACGTQNGRPMFCPNQLVDRGWGAYLIVKARNLPLP